MLLTALREAAGPAAGDDPNVVLLSQGPEDSAWFEHRLLVMLQWGWAYLSKGSRTARLITAGAAGSPSGRRGLAREAAASGRGVDAA